jgi:hypothetical protein
MKTSALLTMVIAEVTIVCVALYFFLKVLRTPPKDPDHDSYEDTHS